jgi:hypothetical protein
MASKSYGRFNVFLDVDRPDFFTAIKILYQWLNLLLGERFYRFCKIFFFAGTSYMGFMMFLHHPPGQAHPRLLGKQV